MEAASLTAPAGLIAAPGRRLLRLRTDDQLVALFRLGNDEAFRVIHDRYRTRLFAYTRQMLAGSASDAEDALQDVFLRAYGALRADDRPVTLRAWLYRVAHNRCIDHLRRPANQPTGELFENLSSLHDPLADIQRRDDLRRLVADVRRLPEQQRSALLMREMEGLTYAELADALGVTVPSVKSLLVRARIGLTEAREARDTACVEIRSDLVAAHDRGVRLSGRARRHVRECAGCAEYRGGLQNLRKGFAALDGGSTGLGALAKLLGLGGAGGGAAASAGGGGAVAGGAVAAGGGVKVAALVCCAAVVGGGAVEASHKLAPRSTATAAEVHRAVPRTLPLPSSTTRAVVAVRAEGPGGLHEAPAGRAATTATRRRAATPARSRARAEARGMRTRAAAATEPATLGGSSADEDAQLAVTAGGMLAPDAAADPEPLAAPAAPGSARADAAPEPPAAVPPAAVPPTAPPAATTAPATGVTGPG